FLAKVLKQACPFFRLWNADGSRAFLPARSLHRSFTVGHNLVILAAGLLVGQTSDIQYTSQAQGQGNCACNSSGQSGFSGRRQSQSSNASTDGRPFFKRLFGRQEDEGVVTTSPRSGWLVGRNQPQTITVVPGGQVPVIQNIPASQGTS